MSKDEYGDKKGLKAMHAMKGRIPNRQGLYSNLSKEDIYKIFNGNL